MKTPDYYTPLKSGFAANFPYSKLASFPRLIHAFDCSLLQVNPKVATPNTDRWICGLGSFRPGCTALCGNLTRGIEMPLVSPNSAGL